MFSWEDFEPRMLTRSHFFFFFFMSLQFSIHCDKLLERFGHMVHNTLNWLTLINPLVLVLSLYYCKHEF